MGPATVRLRKTVANDDHLHLSTSFDSGLDPLLTENSYSAAL